MKIGKTKFKIKNLLKVKELIKIINHKKNDLKISILELSLYIEDYPKCEICGQPIYFEQMYFQIKNDYLHLNIPLNFEQKFKDNTFYISKCIDCVKDNFKDDLPSMQRYLFNLRSKWAKFIYDIPDKIHEEIKYQNAITLENLIKKYGEIEGKNRFEKYCQKQAFVNSFEHKQKKYGWTKEKFDEFNKSRACTLENFIERHGEELGKRKWEEYVNIQKETKSWEYMVKKFGEEKALEINKSHAITLENLIKKYGENIGKEKWNNFINKSNKFYSEISQKLFRELDTKICKKSYFATKNTEFSIYDKNTKQVYLLDYYLPDYKICVEFDGDIFHANPKKFKETDCPNPFDKKLTAKEIWNKDLVKQKIIESNGIKVIRIWESEYLDKNFDINKFIEDKLKIELHN